MCLEFSCSDLWLNNLELAGLPGWRSGEESAYSAGDADSIRGSGRTSGGGRGNSLQCSCLENPMDRGGWWAAGELRSVGLQSRTRLSRSAVRPGASQERRSGWSSVLPDGGPSACCGRAHGVGGRPGSDPAPVSVTPGPAEQDVQCGDGSRPPS